MEQQVLAPCDCDQAALISNLGSVHRHVNTVAWPSYSWSIIAQLLTWWKASRDANMVLHTFVSDQKLVNRQNPVCKNNICKMRNKLERSWIVKGEFLTWGEWEILVTRCVGSPDAARGVFGSINGIKNWFPNWRIDWHWVRVSVEPPFYIQLYLHHC